MSDHHDLPAECQVHELRFAHRLVPGRVLTFPCDADGHVDMDRLSDSARVEYLYARAVIGLEFARPTVLLRPGC